jgi:hypothetical protein
MLRTTTLALLFALAACGSKSPPPTTGGGTAAGTGDGTGDPAQSGACIKTGCSGTVCTEAGNDVVTTCEFKPEYACYQQATCEPQPDGKCGWTQTDALKACLANPPPAS